MTLQDILPLMRDFGPAALRHDAEPAYDPGALIDHILERYHHVHREEFPEAIRLARKVEAVHADRPDAPHGLANHLAAMFDELEGHQKREELVLFPTLRSGGCSIVQHAIARMMAEHKDQERQLAELRRFTGGHVAPDGACRTWRALVEACRKIDEDLGEHMRLENEVLFAPFVR